MPVTVMIDAVFEFERYNWEDHDSSQRKWLVETVRHKYVAQLRIIIFHFMKKLIIIDRVDSNFYLIPITIIKFCTYSLKNMLKQEEIFVK